MIDRTLCLRLCWPLAALTGLCLYLSGCSREACPYRKATRRVVGTVRVDGQPPETPVQITCHLLSEPDPEHPTSSSSVTGPEGRFEISTYEAGDGVPVGEYALTFEWKALNLVSRSYGGPDRLKRRYQDPATSEVRFTVEENAAREPLDLGLIALTTE